MSPACAGTGGVVELPAMRLPVLIAAAALALPATAAAAPPPNDNYLASSTIATEQYRDSVDTTEATTQPDLFNPDKDGRPLGGGDPEPTACIDGGSFGKTVWWDFRPPSPGRVKIRVDAGFDVVVAVYTWNPDTSRITRTVRCQNDEAGSEDVLIPRVSGKTDYTIQVGGANGAGGPLNFVFDRTPDTDGDGILDDEPDQCRRQPGIERLGGCPPKLRSSPRITYTVAGAAIRITALSIDDVPKGARAEVRCGRKVSRRASRRGTLEFTGCAGRTIGAGGRIEMRVTLGRTGKGQYRYGAVGRYFRWPIEPGRLGKRRTRCLQPGSRKPTKCR
jgi:hypothetical protein